MADRMLFMTWGTPVRGAEERGVEVFNEALGLLGRLQQDGKIEKFDVALLAPNGALNGYISVQGTAAQISALHENPEWRRNTVDDRRRPAPHRGLHQRGRGQPDGALPGGDRPRATARLTAQPGRGAGAGKARAPWPGSSTSLV